MSLVRRMFPFTRRGASTAAAAASAVQSTPAPAPAAPQAEAIPSVDELRRRARKVYKEVSVNS